MTDRSREGFPAAPRSGIESIVWPAYLPDLAAKLLAIEFQLEQSEWWTEAELREHQLGQLGHLLSHTQASVPFYGAKLAAAGYRPGEPLTPEIWGRLPILDRSSLQTERDMLTSRALPPAHGSVTDVQIDRGLGPLILRISEVGQLLRLAIFVREQVWQARELTGKRAALRADQVAPAPGGRREENWGWPMGLLYETGPQTVLDRSASLDQQVAWLLLEEPAYLIASPADALALAREFQGRSLRLPSLKGVQSLGGGLSPEVRNACRDAWGVPLVHFYRVEEVGPLALQCPEHEHFHVQSEQAMVEVLDDQGRPCGPGETGRVVATSLGNFAMPLIRYDTGDTAEVGAPCPCGRGLPVLTRIFSREPRA
jgi:phenylacetate-CoA ligase